MKKLIYKDILEINETLEVTINDLNQKNILLRNENEDLLNCFEKLNELTQKGKTIFSIKKDKFQELVLSYVEECPSLHF